LYYLKLLKI